MTIEKEKFCNILATQRKKYNSQGKYMMYKKSLKNLAHKRQRKVMISGVLFALLHYAYDVE